MAAKKNFDTKSLEKAIKLLEESLSEYNLYTSSVDEEVYSDDWYKAMDVQLSLDNTLQDMKSELSRIG